MKERPILFSGPMVRAILDGRKTQTRRVVDVSRLRGGNFDHRGIGAFEWMENLLWRARAGGWNVWSKPIKCPFGQPGDRLWVRETWAAVHFSVDPETGYCDDWHGSHDIPPAATPYWTPVYAADDGHEKHIDDRGFPWRPSIHMPRWASRITLEVTGVRVERLNDISEPDARAEGIEMVGGPTCVTPWRNYRKGEPGEMSMDCSCPSRSFMSLWESINGAGSWNANPWVWVIEFRRV